MLRQTLISLVLALVAVSTHANDDRTRTIIGAGLGAAVGAAIGSEPGGRNEAILGGAIGGAIGTVIATKDRHNHYPRYRRPDRQGWRCRAAADSSEKAGAMGSDSEDCLYVAHVLLPAAFWSRDKELNSPDGVPQVSPAHKHDIF